MYKHKYTHTWREREREREREAAEGTEVVPTASLTACVSHGLKGALTLELKYPTPLRTSASVWYAAGY
jgi:hypothetical protein